MLSRNLQLNCLGLDRLAASTQREAWGASKVGEMEKMEKMKKMKNMKNANFQKGEKENDEKEEVD